MKALIMNDPIENRYVHTEMSGELFNRLSDIIYSESGIKMPLTKKTMLESRLQKRLREIGIGSFGEYCNYLFSPDGIANELIHMIDVVTTNITEFFREPQHFAFLIEHVIPDLINTNGCGMRSPLMLWSAACSSGEEVYSLGMILNEFSSRAQGFHFTILGTDISTRMLDKAKDAIYDEDRIRSVPLYLRKKYLLRSKDKSRKQVRIVPALRSLVRFRRLNFMADDFGMREEMDVIFCRNVLIYFDRQTQERVINRLCNHLRPGGYLFTGHSEALNGMDVPLEIVANTVSRRL